MSDRLERKLGKMPILRKTGKFITHGELEHVTQLFGRGVDTNTTTQEAVDTHNTFMKMLAMRYEYDYTKCEIHPLTGEILERCEDCTEELKEEDVEVEE